MFEIHGWDSEATYAKVFNNLIPWWRAQAYLHFDNIFGSVTNNRISLLLDDRTDSRSVRLSNGRSSPPLIFFLLLFTFSVVAYKIMDMCQQLIQYVLRRRTSINIATEVSQLALQARSSFPHLIYCISSRSVIK